jgi:hypothetical protein
MVSNPLFFKAPDVMFAINVDCRRDSFTRPDASQAKSLKAGVKAYRQGGKMPDAELPDRFRRS